MNRMMRTRPDARPLRAVLPLAALLLLAGATLAACTTDQVLDPARYWSDRLTGVTLDADPAND